MSRLNPFKKKHNFFIVFLQHQLQVLVSSNDAEFKGGGVFCEVILDFHTIHSHEHMSDFIISASL